MLNEFCTIRNALKNSKFLRDKRRISGLLTVTDDNLNLLNSLQADGYIEECRKGGKNCSYLPDVKGQEIEFSINPKSLPYYEDIEHLVSYAVEEPHSYYVRGIGNVTSEANGGAATDPLIESYRSILRARKLLRATADLENTGNATFLTPEKLEIPLAVTSADTPVLTHLQDLQRQFEKRPEQDPADRDQRLVLFRKNLREYLKAQPPEERFRLFLRNFETIYDSYSRDYQLWVGNTFGELEKSFEEKRLKFVADLNGILAGVQASILAVPIAAILLGDKYDLANPLKDFLLALGICGVAVIAYRLLENQEATLNATREAINATREDFEKKHTKRKQEFQTRLQGLDAQEMRVRTLLRLVRSTIVLIAIFGLFAFVVAWHQTATASGSPQSAGTNIVSSGTLSNSPPEHPASQKIP